MAVDGLAAPITAGRFSLFDARIEGIDCSVLLTSKYRPILDGKVLKVITISCMPRIQRLKSNIRGAALPDEHGAVALRRTITGLRAA